MTTQPTSANEPNQKQETDPGNEQSNTHVDEFEIEVRELQRPVRPRGVLAE